MRRILPLLFAALSAAYAQKYTGPPPPKPDLPYIKHATSLLATEPVEAKEEKSNNDVLYIIDGANSPVKTPLALPIFVIKTDKLNPQNLRLYRLESKDGRRELAASSKKNAAPIHVEVMPLDAGNLFQLGVYDSLDVGEYALAAEGSKQMFCFQVE